ncbi:MAG: RIP metalloprotease RseP [Bacteroidales bacterium]
MEILIKALQFFLSLSVLIIIHEVGHMIPARLFKTRVEKFYLFFNPWFSLFKFRRGETEYGMGWLPLGGYVKISGMIDESMDKEQMKKPPQPHEFRAKPAWQRLIIMLGGVTANIILAALIYIVMLFIAGEQYLPAKNLKYGIVADSLATEIGMQTGDKILMLDEEPVEDFMDIPREFVLGDVHTVTVERNGDLVRLDVPSGFFGRLISNRMGGFFSVRYPYVVEDFLPDSPAREAGVQVGDHIRGIGGHDTWSFDEFAQVIGQFAGKETTLTVERDGEIMELEIAVSQEGRIGAYAEHVSNFLDFETRNYTLLESVPAGITKAYTTTTGYFRELRLLFRPEVKVSENLGGFITIGSIFSPTWDWIHFWTITAFLSIILAIMNVLPIPALDGGHVMFLLYEIIAGRKPGEKFMEYAQMVGMLLLLSLLVFVNFNDILRLFR